MEAHPPLRILLVEDSPADAELVLRALRPLGRELLPERVADAGAMVAALRGFGPQLIVSDHSMPGFDGLQALGLRQQHAPDVPFIFVSGTMGEEAAIEALHNGASDYVLKGNLRRLPSAVQRALALAREREERRAVERALRASEERFRSIVETTEEWIWECDAQGVITYSNPAVQRILGRAVGETLGRNALTLMHPEERTRVQAEMQAAVAARRGWNKLTLRWLHRDGGIRWLESHARPMLDEQERVQGFRGVDHDVTERIRQHRRIERLARMQAFLAALGQVTLRAMDRDALLQGVCRVALEHGGFEAAWIGVDDGDGCIRLGAWAGVESARAVVEEMLPLDLGSDGVTREYLVARAMLGGHPVEFGDVEHADLEAGTRERLRRIGARALIVLPLGAGPWGVLALHAGTATRIDDEDRALLVRAATEVDYAREYIASAERLSHLAYHHPVTGMPNRTAFREQLQSLLEKGGAGVAILYVAGFYNHVGLRGREFAEAMLAELGGRLRGYVPDTAIVAQLGDHSFAVGLPSAGATPFGERAADLVERVQAEPLGVDGERVLVALRVGLAEAAEGTPAGVLEACAESAVAESIRSRRPVSTYSPEFHERVRRRAQLERDLRVALADQQLELFYQPKYTVAEQRLTGAEALLRWRHPERGLVAPWEFIPVAEESGLIVDIGRWVRQQAVAQAMRWRDAGLSGLRVAVNLSARELADPRLVEHCSSLLEGHRGDQLLDLELTESLVMDDVEHSIALLLQLRDFDVRVAIDDFGTGYSSLNYLSRLPVDMLKIDRSFVADIGNSPDAMSLVSNMIQLAHSVGLKVVAEGVEEQDQARLLRLLRCDEMQGYLFGRPVPAADFERAFLT